MSYITDAITQLTKDRVEVHKLRLQLIAYLRQTNDAVGGNAMIQEYVDGLGIHVPGGHDYLNYLPDLIHLKSVLAPTWTTSRFEKVGDFWAISVQSPDQSYDCKYVATNPLFPLAVSIITARLMDFGKKIDDIGPVITNS